MIVETDINYREQKEDGGEFMNSELRRQIYNNMNLRRNR
jgi:hypothetical protein